MVAANLDASAFRLMPVPFPGNTGSCKTGQVSSPAGRSYSGLPADERLARRRQRLLEVGLDILGAPDGLGDLTLRTVCQRSGLAQRYFYESFADKDEYAVAIFDWAVEGLASTIEAKVAAAPPRLQVRAGITSVVRAVNADRRIGQLLYSPTQVNPLLVRRRFEATAMFVSLFAQHLRDWFRRDDQGNLPVLAHFIVGGVGQAVTAWLHRDVEVSEDELIEQLVDMLLAHGPEGSAQL
ncbi:hypothetical protein CCUG63695_00117 [Mycobacteroides franklinii]|uniref:HTH tetR-type domain-containing protein n=1 Tax=Mycobacteroides franklinii TaxID=948102 RepID=A0A4R8R238_9MYCO|nr:hypothetical protein CCUG64054_00751 [Mycobacteroides franklinii]TDZ48598.1 hypothetical protein CCUG63697_03127 [Mycobacteroides franklinii]TDZ58778.1 hypothetical protein CCUG63696_00753 [Mycobacteroides franklinii]TDZ66294.1 hypothetical protein CCUG63695_00117 [Mycobacteroides franklinii]TDZ72217.1 hypothetical protein CCUG64056_00751 [Mycobacteroides franklinii]